MNEKIECSVCHKKFNPSYLWTHKRKQHGILGGKTGRIRHVYSKPEVVTVSKINGQVQPKFTVAPFLVLEDNNGGIWLAEKIR